MKRLLLLLSAITCLPIAVSAQTYSITNTGASSQWCKIGTFTPVLTGATIRIKAYVHNGYNASNSQDALIEILFKNSNGASVNEYGFAGNSMYSIFGASSHSYEVKWLANAGGNSATAYDLYIYFPWYTYNSQYTVSIGEVSSWTNICSIGQSDPGNNSSTVLIAEHSFNILHTNVGIGTTMPLVKLQLQGSSTTGTVETEEIFKKEEH